MWTAHRNTDACLIQNFLWLTQQRRYLYPKRRRIFLSVKFETKPDRLRKEVYDNDVLKIHDKPLSRNLLNALEE